MICGGSTVSDSTDPAGAGITSQIPASDQCIRLLLTTAGIAAGWQVEQMPTPRVMGELLHMPDGRILLINGAQTGVSSFVCPDAQYTKEFARLQVMGMYEDIIHVLSDQH